MLERTWFLTWTTYGTWLPGDRRGHVSNVRGDEGVGVRLNQPGSVVSGHNPALENKAHQLLKCDPIYLTNQHAKLLADEFRRTAEFRQWDLAALAIMAQHVHLLITASDDPDPEKLLGEFKEYGSRVLNRRYGRPKSETWWSIGGSKGKVVGQDEFIEKLNYINEQNFPLVIWINPKYTSFLKSVGEPGPRGPGCSHLPDA